MGTPATYQLAASVKPGVLQLQPRERVVYKRNGIAERTSVYISVGEPLVKPPFQPLYTPYPDQNTGGFVCDTCEVEGPNEGGFWKTTVVWVSIWTSNTSYSTLDAKTIQVPIAQSPNFTRIAGSPSAPLNNAVFDANGQFIGFGPGPFQGVVSAFIPQTTLTIRGSGSSPGTAGQGQGAGGFLESLSNTQRGSVFEWEAVYNLSINAATGIPNVLDNN